MKRKLPDHISGTVREWRKRKRRELVEAERALKKFLNGCLYCPGGKNIGVILNWFRDARKAMRGNWNPRTP